MDLSRIWGPCLGFSRDSFRLSMVRKVDGVVDMVVEPSSTRSLMRRRKMGIQEIEEEEKQTPWHSPGLPRVWEHELSSATGPMVLSHMVDFFLASVTTGQNEPVEFREISGACE